MKVNVDGIMMFGVIGELQIQEDRLMFLTSDFEMAQEYTNNKSLGTRKAFGDKWQITTSETIADEFKDLSHLIEVAKVPNLADPRLGIRFRNPLADDLLK